MSNIQKTIAIEIPEGSGNDELVECIMFLRKLAGMYTNHLDIAYYALQRESRIPPSQVLAENHDH